MGRRSDPCREGTIQMVNDDNTNPFEERESPLSLSGLDSSGRLSELSHSPFHSIWSTERYPACSKESRASAAMTADSTAPIASTGVSLLLAAALRHALRQVPGKLFVIWDGSLSHRSKVVKEFLRSGANARLQLKQLPGYASELNSDEGIWKHLKYVELKDVCCRSLSGLRWELRKVKERLGYKETRHLGCIRQA